MGRLESEQLRGAVCFCGRLSYVRLVNKLQPPLPAASTRTQSPTQERTCRETPHSSQNEQGTAGAACSKVGFCVLCAGFCCFFVCWILLVARGLAGFLMHFTANTERERGGDKAGSSCGMLHNLPWLCIYSSPFFFFFSYIVLFSPGFPLRLALCASEVPICICM